MVYIFAIWELHLQGTRSDTARRCSGFSIKMVIYIEADQKNAAWAKGKVTELNASLTWGDRDSQFYVYVDEDKI